MKVSKNRICAISLLGFLLIISTGHVLIQLFCILFFGIAMTILKGIDRNKNFNIFYIFLILISLSQIFLVYKSDYSFNFILNTTLITFMWFLAYLAHNFIVNSVKLITVGSINKTLNIFFSLNVFLVAVEYVAVCFQAESIFPFGVERFGMSTGDYLKGFFVNSSVNMVIMAFFATYYFFEKSSIKTAVSIIVMILTTYMSGIILALLVLAIYGFFMFNYKNKIKIVLAIIIGIYIFSIISPENIKYVKHVLNDKINSKTDPARKVVSFEQTASNFFSTPSSFLFGEGGGKFSSRTAYLTGGEYVSWYPKELVYRSDKFENNHFQLWNNKALSIAFRDGTANQPFSFYNKIIGEYGLLGILLFLVYLSYFLKIKRYLTYGKLILPLMLAFFILDYWFEYFTVILFFELFMLLDIKKNKQFADLNPGEKIKNYRA